VGRLSERFHLEDLGVDDDNYVDDDDDNNNNNNNNNNSMIPRLRNIILYGIKFVS
jgi:hypothetical protein